MVMDCGPLNRCGALYIGFMLVLVEVGFYDIGVLVFLQVSRLAVRVVKTRPSNAGPNYKTTARGRLFGLVSHPNLTTLPAPSLKGDLRPFFWPDRDGDDSLWRESRCWR